MELGIQKCPILNIKSGKRQIIEGLELPNQERIRTPREKENCNDLGILKADTNKRTEMLLTYKSDQGNITSLNLLVNFSHILLIKYQILKFKIF